MAVVGVGKQECRGSVTECVYSLLEAKGWGLEMELLKNFKREKDMVYFDILWFVLFVY